MKIGIDARCLMQKKYSGISWYTFNLIQSLAEFDRDNEYVLFYNSSKEIELLKFPGDNFENVVFKYPNKIINQSFSLFNYPQIDKMLGGVDVFFMPNMNFMACSDSCKRVITVHDLSFLRYPQFWT